MDIKIDYSDVHFKNDGRIKLLILVGTRGYKAERRDKKVQGVF